MYNFEEHKSRNSSSFDEEQRLYDSSADNYSDGGHIANDDDLQRTRSNSKPRIKAILTSLSSIFVLITTLAVGYYLGSRSNKYLCSVCTFNDQNGGQSTTTNQTTPTVSHDTATSVPQPSAATAEKTIPHVPLSTIIKPFLPNDIFMEHPEHGKAEPAWDSLLPQGLGYIRSDLIDQDILSGYAPTTALSVVSVFHQLHCLYMLRSAFFANSTDEIHGHGRNGNHEDSDFGSNSNGVRFEHATHCFEYLRQSLICSADSSLEPADFSKDEYFGWGINRQCRSYDAIRDWASDRRMFDDQSFLAKDLHTHVQDDS